VVVVNARDYTERLLDELAEVRAKRIGGPIVRPSWEHNRISKMRADHDRVTKAELEAELRTSRLANDGQQSEAARVLGVTEGALRHWRNPEKGDCLPPRWALTELRRKRQKDSGGQRVA
jgi:hypothetical protein